MKRDTAANTFQQSSVHIHFTWFRVFVFVSANRLGKQGQLNHKQRKKLITCLEPPFLEHYSITEIINTYK